jgi:benzoylformate decarboxylase
MPTVRDATFNLLRKLGIDTIVGNPGSTEETFLKEFPDDFNYVLALQEASVVGIADGLSQSLRKPVIVNVHTGAGMGNAMGCILTSFVHKTPLIITAGQQTRDMLLCEPFLMNVEAVNLPKPWVKWSYEPTRAEDVPGAFMRAYAMAVQQPSGPVFLSLPLDDWDQEIDKVDVFRTVSTRIAPDPARIRQFAERIDKSDNPLLLFGADIAHSDGWNEAIAFAEKINAPVYNGPFSERVSFPENHRLFAGHLPSAIGPIEQALEGHDLVVVVGAPVFRYYPWVPGHYLPAGTRLLQITDNPYEAAKAVIGDSLVSDCRLALAELTDLVREKGDEDAVFEHPPVNPETVLLDVSDYPLTADQVFAVLSEHVPEEYILVQESPSNIPELESSRVGTISNPDSYYTMGSGGLGWDLPAAVGLALGEQKTGRNRPVIVIIGDGSFQYSPQAIWTGVQHNLHMVIVALRNEEYAILKAFAQLEKTPGVPGLDVPGLDIVSLANGYGAKAVRATKIEEIETAFNTALEEEGVTVIEVSIDKHVKSLLH